MGCSIVNIGKDVLLEYIFKCTSECSCPKLRQFKAVSPPPFMFQVVCQVVVLT